MIKWSKEINKSFGKERTRFYPKRNAVSMDGFSGGQPVYLVTIALKGFQEGETCPYCGDRANPDETSMTVKPAYFENDHSLPSDPYIEATCQCQKCAKWWTVRQKGTEICLDYTPERSLGVPFSLSKHAYISAILRKLDRASNG